MEYFFNNPFIVIILIGLWFLILLWFVNTIFTTLIKSLTAKTKNHIDDILLPIVKKLLLVLIVTTGIYSILLRFDFSAVFLNEIYRGYLFAIVIFVALASIRISKILFLEFNRTSAVNKEGEIHSAIPLVNNVLTIGIIALFGLVVLRIYEIDITPAIASAGIVGVALAFAAKDLVANLFGGISVFFDKPYQIGDYVIINEHYRGEVIEIGTRSTKIKTRDNILVTVPNSVMVTNAVINETGFEPSLRVRIPIQIAYKSNLEKVEKIIISTVKTHREILHDPAPIVRYRQFADSGINLEVLVVIAHPADRGRIVHELIKLIFNEFQKKDIDIPYPQRDVRLYKAK
ncbi:hypothetical protein A3H80_03105 [Candidatus Roizmanbacteria bacterium RIFCSPLOWO2_02_FULL_37_19]|uniref:Mechanosensitive ion channel protein MscS n=1 Tax=Candidatus Roizmanbacteria bacterium RIFCSPHIGHO2_02_FULL_37_24 TaxID=1802037 RepID=A0A1F7H0Y2_9BACT|nr:MAG: hypothetical protein A2862_04060 [Candidatus Roizmanbacteria bacterium RIFCSPHIGHO2_01_FULL_38_41]OGK24392.1 MAG: hypothetical protein A3C24_04510 [Candidatus Roizmanbacteria bacterium RIFCSPHIGHO2_02_FULL_37_24]OGK33985.1 MAG: hypothetical protein A3E10_04030 [Candidatus Roizmanbacteria bacterium RIFCSPHIGHO2_12_FULL_37_23]OGK43321.1 MAG: hypothetical protein A2956_03720 [Candidatus Roizmanbacteria bacterium RIFCSPLOWO2_01_FULL_37_57]OGK54073.1 MAG: hypothetical protein A3H80_03105 [Ca